MALLAWIIKHVIFCKLQAFVTIGSEIFFILLHLMMFMMLYTSLKNLKLCGNIFITMHVTSCTPLDL